MKRNSAFLKLTLALCLAFTACGGDDGEQGPRGPGGATGPEGDAGTAGSDGANALVTQTPVGPDDQCSNGGVRIDSGPDTNRDGTLNEDEITATNIVCNGASPFSLQLLHFADVDGNEATALDNVDEFSALVDGFRNDEFFGPRTLVVSSGDNVIPGPRWFAAEDSSIRAITGSNQPGHADHFFMNEFGVVASAIGNHELDQGPGEFADSIASGTFEDEDAGISVTFEGTRFPYLAANIDFSAEADLSVGEAGADSRLLGGQVAPSATVAIGGETIGLVGVSTPALSAITSAGRLSVSGSTTEIAELAAAVQPTIDALVTEGINKIIVLAHLQQIALEKALAEELRHVDVIVAGGSNTRMGNPVNTLYPGDAEFDEAYPFETTDADGNPIVVVNVDGDYKYLGRLVVDFDENGVVIPSSINPVVSGVFAAVEEDVAFSRGTPIESVVELRDALDIVIAEQFSNVVGHTDVFLEGRRGIVRTEETNLGNLTADSLKWYAQRCTDLTNVIALKNGGGIRAEIGNAVTVGTETTLEPPFNDGLEGVDPGDVSEGHFRGSLRFDNGAVVVSVTPAELKLILEHAVAETAPGATPGQFPQVGGIWVGFDPAGTAQVLTVEGEGDDRVVTGVATPGTRVTDLWVDTDANGMVDTALYTDGVLQAEEDARYDLVTLNFIANGGDDAPFALLSDPMRRQLYEGLGFDDPDEDDNDMADFPMLMGCDPGLQNDFSGTGREQDILAEYFLEFHPDPMNAFAVPETAPIDDRRVQNLSIIETFVEPMGPVAVATPQRPTRCLSHHRGACFRARLAQPSAVIRDNLGHNPPKPAERSMSLTTLPVSASTAGRATAEPAAAPESAKLGFDMSDRTSTSTSQAKMRAAEGGCLAGPKLAGPAWREASRFIEASPAQIMAAAEARIRSTANQGRRPVVVIDLDSTVYDNGPRTAHLARRFAEAHGRDPVFGKEAAKMATFAPRHATFSFEDMARSAGVAVKTPEGKAAVGAFTKFWLSGFFSDALVPLDQPYPRAVSAVRRLLDAAPEAPPDLQPMVVFLTGRHRAFVPDQEKDDHLRDGMERGTRAALRRDGLPADPPRALSMMKDSFREPDSDFKGRVREQINRLGTVVATFDNEPANVAEFVAGYPAMHVYVHTIDSGKEAQPVRGVYKMGPGDNSSAHWPA